MLVFHRPCTGYLGGWSHMPVGWLVCCQAYCRWRRLHLDRGHSKWVHATQAWTDWGPCCILLASYQCPRTTCHLLGHHFSSDLNTTSFLGNGMPLYNIASNYHLHTASMIDMQCNYTSIQQQYIMGRHPLCSYGDHVLCWMSRVSRHQIICP